MATTASLIIAPDATAPGVTGSMGGPSDRAFLALAIALAVAAIATILARRIADAETSELLHDGD
jgi:hypothetical protein